LGISRRAFGSLDPTVGLSARFMKDGAESVSRRLPASVEELTSLLQSYRAGNGRWREMIEWE
jgi:hypothetical protein